MSEASAPVIICVPVCERRASRLPAALARACDLGDFVELRLDCLAEDELHEALQALPALVSSTTRPLILTLRPRAEGGHSELSEEARLDFWASHLPLLDSGRAFFADIELDLAERFQRAEIQEKRLNWEQVICSHHDFAGVPANLHEIYERMARTPARILKMAVRARDITDCLAVFRLLERALEQARTLIAVAMGEAGMMTRILGPARGSFLTYASADERHATAPGQLGANELRWLYRIERINRETVVTGLLGSPVIHSVSPHMHNAAFEARSLNAVYLPFEVGDASEFLRRMVRPRTREIAWRLRGLSVTAPHKLSVVKHLDQLDQTAREIGAVNTIVMEGEELHGYNTDAAAFLAPLEEIIGPISKLPVALIGAGGAARAALWALNRAGARATLFVREPERARELAAEFGAEVRELEGASFADFKVVANATPLGTRGERESLTPALSSQLRGARLAYDLVYNPSETRFMHEAQAAGCGTLGGLPMLVAQAAEQFRLWTGEEAPRELMFEAARAALV